MNKNWDSNVYRRFGFGNNTSEFGPYILSDICRNLLSSLRIRFKFHTDSGLLHRAKFVLNFTC